MRKRSGIILVGLLTVGLIVSALFIRREKLAVVIDPWEAVPADAFFIVETEDFPELLTRVADPAGLLSGLSAMEWAASLVGTVSAIDSITGGREVRELISNRRVVISFHTAGKREPAPLVTMSTGPLFSGRKLSALLAQTGAVVTGGREPDGTRIFTATYGHGNRQMTLHAALTSGIVIMTPSDNLLRSALDNRGSGYDIRHQQGFAPVAGAAGKGADNLFVLFRNLPGFLSTFIQADEIAEISSVAVAAGGDLNVAEGGIFVSGFLTTSGSGAGADRLKEVTPAECGVHELLPRSILTYSTLMRRASLTGETATDPSSINASDLALILSPYTGTEVTMAMTGEADGKEWVRLFRMTDPKSAEETLRQRVTARYRATGVKDDRFIMKLNGEGDAEETIYRMPFSGVSSILAGGSGRRGGEAGRSSESSDRRSGDEWVTFARSYMIFARSPETLRMILKEAAAGNTLINDPEFRELEKTVPTRSSYLFYTSGREISSLLSGLLTHEAAGALNERALSAISGIGVSLTPSNEMIYTSLSVRYTTGDAPRTAASAGLPAATAGSAAAAPETGTGATVAAGGREEGTAAVTDPSALKLLWRVKLDAPPAIKPYFFTNHNTGATEVFIQDQRNTIYLFSASGRLLWKAPVRERINGEIFMIDYYRNGKWQLLFAGRDYLHLIDRNGNYVDRYPVKLRSPASNTLALFDYEGNKDYRLCIAGDDRIVYVYDRSGTPVRGWNLFTARGRVADPVSFFRVKGKDYLFVADDQAVYLLDRTGNIRVAHEEPLVKAAGSAARLTGGDEPAIMFSSPDGATVRLMFDGTVRRHKAEGLSASHQSDFADVDGDNQTDRITLDQGRLMVFDGEGRQLWSYDAGGSELQGPVIFTIGAGDRRIAFYDAGKGLLHLTGRNGAAVSGFPLRTGSFYNIGRVSNKTTWNLVINDSENFISNYVISFGSR